MSNNKEAIDKMHSIIQEELKAKAVPVEEKKQVEIKEDTDTPTKKIVKAEVKIPEQDEPNDLELKAMEAYARKSGWRPKEEYKGNTDDWVDADIFVARGPNFRYQQKLKEKIEEEAKKNEELRGMVKGLVGDLRNADERAKEKALIEIKAQMYEAERANDLKKHKELEKRAEEIHESKAKVKEQKAQSPEDVINSEEFQGLLKDFISSGNDWFNKDGDDELAMRAYAQAKVIKYEKDNPKSTHKDQLDFIHSTVREKYPDYFGIKDELEEAEPEVEIVEKAEKSFSSERTNRQSELPKVTVSSGLRSGGTPESKFNPSRVLAKCTDQQKSLYNSFKTNKELGIDPNEFLKSLQKTYGY